MGERAGGTHGRGMCMAHASRDAQLHCKDGGERRGERGREREEERRGPGRGAGGRMSGDQLTSEPSRQG